ncbi:hypothetical protein JG687_00017294 [Phytophthora cactorum]|uniref:Uncharacterized protein n=1 Tax=Phytophthora cactorum TaxID=29920 RepID=A0A8T1TNI1_9STRA|nr:hypothetical protein JG687_00017294 [Phytophthora cactorum]
MPTLNPVGHRSLLKQRSPSTLKLGMAITTLSKPTSILGVLRQIWRYVRQCLLF